ncbi:MAG TPA: hypothetical protein VGJ07_32075 [Rugosimonospora sp.]
MSPISEDDLDRLADYAAGVLDPAEAAEVDRLIAGEPAWAEAHARLAAAQPWLDEVLSGLPREPMPVDVAARLERAVAIAPTEPRTAKVLPLPRRRWPRIALTTAAAVAVGAACIGGFAALSRSGAQKTSSSSGVAAPDNRGIVTPGLLSQGPAVPDAVPNAGAGAVPTTATGTDYTHGTLSLAEAGPASATAKGAEAQSVPNLPDGLARLAVPAGLNGCLAAITAVEGGRPVSVDYARYEGQPALIVVLSGGSARVVAAGAGCGLAGEGAALLDSLS